MGFLDRVFGGVPDRNSFAALARKHLETHGETRPISYDEARFQLVVGDPSGAMNILWLGNAYEEYCALPRGRRDSVLSRYVPMPDLDAFDDKQAVLRSLLPRLRDRAYPHLLEHRVRRQLSKPDAKLPALPYRPVGELLAATLCVDLPEQVLNCTEQHFTRWKSSFDELWPVALANLEAMSNQPFRRVAQGVFVSAFCDSHDPARMLLPQLFRALPLKGAPVVGLPNRNTLVVTGAEDDAGLDEFLSQLKLGLKDPRPVMRSAFVLGDSGWAPFSPRAGHPLAVEFNTLLAQALATMHADQKELLAEVFEAEGRDLFIATWNPMLNPDTGAIRTHATWTEGVTTLLPKTEHIGFVVLDGLGPGKADVTQTTWEQMQAVVGHLLEPVPELWPQRWLVDAFPTAEQLAQLKAVAQR
jgi:hypothetical protein